MATRAFWNAAFSSATGQWDTPPSLIADLSSTFPWDLDVCASGPNVCTNYYDGADRGDGLTMPWRGLCWMNPPYGRGIIAWVKRASEVGNGNTIIGLLPARTDTRWFSQYVTRANYVVFIKGRLKFGSPEHWRNVYKDRLMTQSVTSATLGKIGGLHCDEDCRKFVLNQWPKTARISKDDWLKADYLKAESAPFPSMFAVWGYTTDAQKMALAKYGVLAIFQNDTII